MYRIWGEVLCLYTQYWKREYPQELPTSTINQNELTTFIHIYLYRTSPQQFEQFHNHTSSYFHSFLLLFSEMSDPDLDIGEAFFFSRPCKCDKLGEPSKLNGTGRAFEGGNSLSKSLVSVLCAGGYSLFVPNASGLWYGGFFGLLFCSTLNPNVRDSDVGKSRFKCSLENFSCGSRFLFGSNSCGLW